MLAAIPYTRPEVVGKVEDTVQYLDETVIPGEYIYRFLAVTKSGVRGKTSDEVKVYWEIPPGIVEGLRVQAGNRQVELLWDAVTVKADGTPLEAVTYEVFRGMKDAGFGKRPLNTSPLPEPRFIDTDVQNSIDYQYRVRAVRSIDHQLVAGPFSKTVEAIPQNLTVPDHPKNLVALPMEESIRLVWEEVEQADISGYRVYRAQTSEGPWLLLTDQPLSTILFDDRNVERGQWYWYAVTALDNATPPNESPKSDPVQARIP